MQRLYNIALHPLPTTITFYEGSNELRNANPWIVKQADYRNSDCSSLQSIFLTLAGLAQRLPEYKPIYTWLTSPEMQNVKYADSFEIFVSRSSNGEVNVSAKEIGIPEEVINECIADVSASDVNVVYEEQNAGAVVAGEFGSSGNASALDDSKIEFVKKWHKVFWMDYKQKSERYKNFFNEAWRFYVSIMQGGQKISEENFKYFIFSRAYILGKNSESRLLFFPYWSEVQQRPLFAALMIYQNYSKAKHDFLLDLLERTACNLENLYIISLKELESIKSAIGSIMSRNGSHNIGSHVLAALSHNIGTMPDDRVLYQYIQQRMDYIATATTEFPTWRQPMLFVSSVMKQFMMQKHLLNFISRSEGLQAYQFQNPALTASTQPNTIRLHVRRIHDEIKDWEGRGKYSESEYDNFIPYGNEKAGSFERDILVAIPGGVIGQHAFYTIIENILRNAAKHEWATTKSKSDHLDVYIDFHDNPNEGVVEFQVWNDRVNKDKETSDDRNISSLVKTLAERMSASFIDNEGGLRKENWGLAEMRISAGFLRGSDVSLVGGIGVGQKEMLGLIRPLVVGNGEGKECLGYRFDLHKPRELLVVLPNKYCEGKGARFTADKIISLNKMLSQYGVNVMPESEAEKSKGLAYSYVLVDSFNGKVQGRYNLPFRVLSAGDVINLTNEQTGVCVIARFCGDSFEGVLKKLESISCNINDGPNRKTINELLEQIYSSWLMHVRNQRDDTRIDPDAAKLVIDSKDDGGGGKSLFANANLLYFIFENSFNSAVRSYLSMHTTRTLNPSIAGTLYALTKLSPRKQFSARELSDRAKDNASMMIQLQLIEWGRVAQDNVNVQNGYIGLEANGMDLPSEDEWGGAGAWKNSFCEWKSNCVASAYLDGLTNRSSSTRGAIIEFIKYLAGPILEQARSYLAKYEERYVTLPRLFGVSQKPREEDEATWENGLLKQGILFTSKDEEKISHAKNSAICYWRHGDKDLNDGLMAVREKALYFEPLSGAQSYLSALTELSNDLIAVKDKNVEDGAGGRRINAIRFMTGLVENGIMRVLIMDERTKKFADEHPDVASIFESTRICVLGGEEDVVARLFQDFFEKRSAAFNEKINGVSIKDWEILIIHQGIIDKMFDGLDKKTTIEYFYAWLKKNMRYVVITTGRGAPPNIPSDVRVLPFSVIESTLFKRYPEKLLLVDTVMNMLPIGERNTL